MKPMVALIAYVNADIVLASSAEGLSEWNPLWGDGDGFIGTHQGGN